MADNDDVMNGTTLETMLLLGNIQTECRQMMTDLANEIDESTTIFDTEDDKVEGMAYLLDYLRKELAKVNPQHPQTLQTPAAFISLGTLLNLKKKQYVHGYIKKMHKDLMKDVDREEYNRWKNSFYENYLPPSSTPPSESLHHGGFEVVDAADGGQLGIAGSVGRQVLQAVCKWGTTALEWQGLQALDEILTAVGPNWGHFVFAAGTSIGYIGIVSLYNLWCYRTGSRSAQRCWKNVIDGSLSCAAGAAAGAGIVALAGLLFGPLGWFAALCVGVTSAVVGVGVGIGTNALVGKATTKLFDIPKEEDLERAYILIGLKKSATDSDINRAYRQISRENHPDMVARRDPPPAEAEIEKAVQILIEVQKAVALIKSTRDVERANAGIDESRPWKERFQEFFKNLVNLRRKKRDEDALEAIAFREGFPPVEVFEEGVDLDLPLPRVVDRVRNTWFNFFNSTIGNNEHGTFRVLNAFI